MPPDPVTLLGVSASATACSTVFLSFDSAPCEDRRCQHSLGHIPRWAMARSGAVMVGRPLRLLATVIARRVLARDKPATAMSSSSIRPLSFFEACS
jgi:hypothetical protein